ncbi:run domain Beclin-1-interacting and cysteine-rich domain-containing protein-like isoform X2 [Glandiceps talaboti]
MATKDEPDELRLEHQHLLLALKSTVEGLLASNSTNVWSTYGGLSRLCNDVESILKHGVKQQQVFYTMGSEYWTFIKGLRWLHPISAPLIEQAGKHSADDGMDRGKAWVRQSLQDHNLASQLKILVENQDHLHQCYHENAFLCSQPHYKAVHLCLTAVEENNPALLASIDPKLLKTRKMSHTRSASLPINQPSGYHSVNIANRRDSTPVVLQPPPFTSPKTESILTTSDGHATASNLPSSPIERLERRNSAKNILLSVLEGTDYRTTVNHENTEENSVTRVANDPLLNTEFYLDSNYASSLKSYAEDLRRSSESLNSGVGSRKSGSYSKFTGAKDFGKMSTDVLENGRNKSENRKIGKKKASSMSESDLKNLVEEDEDESVEFPNRNESKDRSKTIGNDKLLFGNDSSDEEIEHHKEKSEQKSVSKPTNIKRPLNQHSRSKSDVGLFQNTPVHFKESLDESGASTTEVDGANLSSSLPTKMERSPSFVDEGVSSPSDCMFPKPEEGQSLMSFLSSQDFQTWPDLDRENAHFSISEAIIAAIEQIKCDQSLKSDNESDASDEEIQELKQRIRIRRRERRNEKAFMSAFGNGKADTTTTTTTSSASPSSSPLDSVSEHSDSGSSDQIDELELTDQVNSSNLTELCGHGLTASLASLYSDADIHRHTQSDSTLTESTNSSADAVAICLLKKFSAKQLPAASDLDWLVSEQDVPQALLPLPKSFPISPDDGENADLVLPNKNIRVRGNLEWAPPRPQIIFNVHPAPRIKVIVAKQNYRCAGCGMKIEPGYVKRLRYCEYLGKYFCHCCHANELSVIPGRILRKWDFRKYAVSNFSRELLFKMQNDPFYNVTDINPSLYRKVKGLDLVRELRTQLYYLKDFLRTCRQGQSMWNEFDKRPHHLIHDINIYSLNDLLKVKRGDMTGELKELVEDAITHVQQCQLCQAKGFICELCNNSDIIFPFELSKCVQCQVCWACYHRNCFVPDKCPKCERIRVSFI